MTAAYLSGAFNESGAALRISGFARNRSRVMLRSSRWWPSKDDEDDDEEEDEDEDMSRSFADRDELIVPVRVDGSADDGSDDDDDDDDASLCNWLNSSSFAGPVAPAAENCVI